MKKILLYIVIVVSLVGCLQETDKIDYYLADTTMSIWSQKFNKSIYEYTGNTDTIIIGVDTLLTWSKKVNYFIDSVPEASDTIVYGTDNFEAWRTKFNNAVDSVIQYNELAVELVKLYIVQPEKALKEKISTFYDTIQFYDVYDSCDCLYNTALHTEQAASIDWIDNSRTATPINSPEFTPYWGYFYDGATTSLNTNYDPSIDAIKYKLNDASIAVYNLTNNIKIQGLMGYSKNSTSYINTDNTYIYNRMNSINISILAHGGNITGFINNSRFGDTLYISRNSELKNSSYDPSSFIDDLPITVGAVNTISGAATHSNNLIPFSSICSYLSELQSRKLFEAERLFLNNSNIVCEGNSLTRGVAGNSGGKSYPELLQENDTIANVINDGTDGAVISAMIADTLNVSADYDDVYENNIIIIWAGLNDLRQDSSVATTHNQLQTLCSYYQEKDFDVIVTTLIASNEKQDSINDYNALIKANYTNYADAIALLDEDSRLQDETNTTYYAIDELHLITEGYTVVEGILQPVINSVKE